MAAKTYTTGQAARQIGVSRQTLQAWIAAGKIKAPDLIEMGRASVRFWTGADIERARKFKGTLKRGRKRKQ